MANFIEGRVQKRIGARYYMVLMRQAEGYTVFRCAGSRPVDLVAIREGKILLVECNTGLRPRSHPAS